MERSALPLYIIFIAWVRKFFARTINLFQKWLRHTVAKGRINLIGYLHHSFIFVTVWYFAGKSVFVAQVIFDFFFAFLQFILNIDFIQTRHGGVCNGMARDFISFTCIFSEIVPTGSYSFLIFRAWFVPGFKVTLAHFGIQAVHQMKSLLFFAGRIQTACPG